MPTIGADILIPFRGRLARQDRDAFLANADNHAAIQPEPRFPGEPHTVLIHFEGEEDPSNPRFPIVLLHGKENAQVRGLLQRMGFTVRNKPGGQGQGH